MPLRSRLITLGGCLFVLLSPTQATADDSTAPSQEAQAKENSAGSFKPLGYLEFYYQWNFNRPSNGVTNLRGFDNRHNNPTLSNAVLGGTWEKGDLSAKLVFQVGHTPNTYYASEPQAPAGSGAASTDANTWKYLQEAWMAYKLPVGLGMTFSGGLFLSPIGPEGLAVKDNYNWSRSNLFFGLPFYHVGMRAQQQLTDHFSVIVAGWNGWNNVTDNNQGKSVSLQGLYEDPEYLSFSILYFGGPERSSGAPEGQAWRHLFDSWIKWRPFNKLWLSLQANAGLEKNNFGTSSWVASAAYAQFKLIDWSKEGKGLYLATRGDFFRETVPGTDPHASAIFWPNGSKYLSSFTATTELRPHDQFSIRLEYRYDQAEKEVFYGQQTSNDLQGNPIATRKNQQSVLFGATAWLP